MRVAVIGTGALACIYAARLAAHAEVCMFGSWPEGVAAIQANGIHVVEPDGRLWRAQVPVYGDPSEIEARRKDYSDLGGADVALILVKSYQTLRAAEWSAELLRPGGVAVTLQNGLDNYEAIVEEVGAARAAIGVTYNAATMLAPGEVRHVAHNPTYLGTQPAYADRMGELAALFDHAGFETEVGEDIEGRLWGKAVVNAAINPLTALWRVPNGALLSTPDRRWLLAKLAEEAANVARAKGLSLPFEDPVAYTDSVCRSTAANHSSMLQDVERGRPTEIDSINGIIISEGKALGVYVGVNEVVWRLVRAL
ncbi:MAG: 2-dehydropantoate 2-reductase [Anaerolineae bacterium]|jgi:2-dehydropantoate 2-reductase|nr:2-dehydropantoate 2-reductase [Anaerolineae bacterium]